MQRKRDRESMPCSDESISMILLVNLSAMTLFVLSVDDTQPTASKGMLVVADSRTTLLNISPLSHCRKGY